ncbi:MAG: hypothetical protein AAB548_01750 [Patescibacteria group bacterium]
MGAKEREQRPRQTIDVLLQAIDIYWDNLLEFPENTIQITSRDPEEDGAQICQQIFTIQRVYDTAYYLKCARSDLTSLGGNGPVFNHPIETIEFRLFPDLFASGRINVTHINAANGITTQAEILIDHLAEYDPTATKTLKDLQLNLLCLLVGHAKEAALFDPMVSQVKDLLIEVYGQADAEELWRAGMSDKDESSD